MWETFHVGIQHPPSIPFRFSRNNEFISRTGDSRDIEKVVSLHAVVTAHALLHTTTGRSNEQYRLTSRSFRGPPHSPSMVILSPSFIPIVSARLPSAHAALIKRSLMRQSVDADRSGFIFPLLLSLSFFLPLSLFSRFGERMIRSFYTWSRSPKFDYSIDRAFIRGHVTLVAGLRARSYRHMSRHIPPSSVSPSTLATRARSRRGS